MAKDESLQEKTERQLQIAADSHLSAEARAGTMNAPYIPDTLGSFAKHKITRFMVHITLKMVLRTCQN